MKKRIGRFVAIFMVAVVLLVAISGSLIGKIDVKAESNGSNTISFGLYPQSRVTDDSIVNSLNSLLSEGDWHSYGYYSGNGSSETLTSSDYMRYADVESNGERYRAVTFSAYRPIKTYYAALAANSFQDDNGYSSGGVYWFKYEPIKWKILDRETGLLLCESIIDAQSFNNYVYKVAVDTDGDSTPDEYISYNDSSSNFYANNYSRSSIRAWLNDDFYNTAFSQSQKGVIKTTTIDNAARASEYTVEDTDDAVFLPSYEDVLNPSYGFNSSDRVVDINRCSTGTDYAKCQGLRVEDSTSDWRLRTAGSGSAFDCRVYNNGEVANCFDDIDFTNAGIRPALCIDSKKVDFNTFGGNNIESQTVFGDELVSRPANPTKEGHTFDDWYIDSDYNTKFDFGESVYKDTTLNAKWNVNPYTITFDTAGGTEIAPITQDYNSPIAVPKNPQKSGFTFAGWDTDIPETMPAEDLTITAIWTVEDTFYNVTSVNADGTFGYTQTNLFTAKNGSDTYTVPDNPTFEGFTFIGWAAAENAEKPNLTANGSYGETNRSFYPVYEINRFTVTYFNDDGTVYKSFSDVVFASEVPKPKVDPAKQDYSFTGWSDSIPAEMPNHSLSFTATYKKDPTVIYYDRENVYAAYIIKEGEPITVPEEPERFGFLFDGWEPEVPEIMPAQDISFTAKWRINPDFVLIGIGGALVSGGIIAGSAAMNTALIVGGAAVGTIAIIAIADRIHKTQDDVDILNQPTSSVDDSSSSCASGEEIPHTGSQSASLAAFGIVSSTAFIAYFILHKRKQILINSKH